MDYATCINEAAYSGALTYGKRYVMLAVDDNPQRPKIKIQANTGRVRWLPAGCFDLHGNEVLTLEQIDVRDAVSDATTSVIEVEITLSNGQRRWCFFAEPQALLHFGDVLASSTMRVHYGVPHLIIVSTITEPIIEQALRHIERHGQLLACTKAVQGSE